jgi:hypothetical protein
MIRFHQTFGAHAGRVVTFEKDVVTIGRLPTCDLSFDARADIDASGQHAEVRREHGAWHVLDANSRNGTWLNGQRVTRAQLNTGDELELGRGGPRLRVEIVAPSLSAPPAPARVDVGLMPTAQWGAEDFLPTNVGAAARPSAGASLRPPAVAYGQIAPTAPPPVAAPNIPTPAAVSPQQPIAPPARGRGMGMGVPIALGGIALLFAGLAVGVLVWRLRASSAAHPPPRPTLPPAAAAAILTATAAPATYLVAGHLADGSLRPLCTAFAVRTDLVATSGHCVKLIQQTRATGVVVDLVRPGLSAPIGIAAMYLHPAFDAASSGASHDVGVIRTAGALAAVLPLPTLDDLRAMTPGGAAYVVTYVATLAPGGAAPSPIIVPGALGTPEHFDGTPSDFEGAQLVPHSAPVEAGGTGAPVLDATGLVIGVHASEARATPSLSVRADVLLALIAGLGA